jgi:dihydropteroate synthase
LHFLSDIGKIVQTEASRAWQPEFDAAYGAPADTMIRTGFDILFSEKSQTLSIKSFVAKVKALIQDQPSLADILQSIVEDDTVISVDTQKMPVADEAEDNAAALIAIRPLL